LLLDFGVFTQFSRISTVWISRFTHLPACEFVGPNVWSPTTRLL